jgi:UDPglucose 6-dehydrogenase
MVQLSIIGTGYVGLVTGTCFAEMGNIVTCVDNDLNKLSKLRSKKLTIYEPGLEVIFNRNVEHKRLIFTDNLVDAIINSEIIFLCLPTPQAEDGSADLSCVLDVAEKISIILKEKNNETYKIVVNKSTVPVGTADKV